MSEPLTLQKLLYPIDTSPTLESHFKINPQLRKEFENLEATITLRTNSNRTLLSKIDIAGIP